MSPRADQRLVIDERPDHYKPQTHVDPIAFRWDDDANLPKQAERIERPIRDKVHNPWHEITLPPSWYDQGLCAQVDPELFYPEQGGTTRPAKKVCAACPVKAQCLEWALQHKDQYGVWGGTSRTDRRKILEERGEAFEEDEVA